MAILGQFGRLIEEKGEWGVKQNGKIEYVLPFVEKRLSSDDFVRFS